VTSSPASTALKTGAGFCRNSRIPTLSTIQA
jgi:hypothetical protein